MRNVLTLGTLSLAATGLMWAACSDLRPLPDATGGAGAGGAAGGAPAGGSDVGGAGGSPDGGGGTGGVPVEPVVLELFDDVRISSKSDQPNFQNAFADVDFGSQPAAQATLIVDLASTCYPFESWQNNPPPAGENWPANCDAFDRNFEFVLDPPEDMGDPPGVELVRSITPFGGPMHYEIDITDVFNGMPGQHQIRGHITTWSDGAGQVSGSDGGWNLTARIEVIEGDAPRNVLAVVPLFDGSQTSLPGPGPIAFDAPAGTTSGRIEYRVTGHGGGEPDFWCIGPAEEFCRREHLIFIDDTEIEALDPWRTDCGQLCTITHFGPSDRGFDYCLENPCGAIGSVLASRANWCPGSVTPPFSWDSVALGMPGSHTFEWEIDRLQPGGSWRISATYFAFGD